MPSRRDREMTRDDWLMLYQLMHMARAVCTHGASALATPARLTDTQDKYFGEVAKEIRRQSTGDDGVDILG